MKRLLAMLAALCMMAALAACGPQPETETEETVSAVSEAEADGALIPNGYGYGEGHLQDTMRTAFFDFTVNDAWLAGEYEGYTPGEGSILLAVDITVYNYTDMTAPMYDLDFEVQWSSMEDGKYSMPVTVPASMLDIGAEPVGDMLPSEYQVEPGQSVQGLLVFEVPPDEEAFSLVYEEVYSDNTTGDVFFVYFTPEESEPF